MVDWVSRVGYVSLFPSQTSVGDEGFIFWISDVRITGRKYYGDHLYRGIHSNGTSFLTFVRPRSGLPTEKAYQP